MPGHAWGCPEMPVYAGDTGGAGACRAMGMSVFKPDTNGTILLRGNFPLEPHSTINVHAVEPKTAKQMLGMSEKRRMPGHASGCRGVPWMSGDAGAC